MTARDKAKIEAAVTLLRQNGFTVERPIEFKDLSIYMVKKTAKGTGHCFSPGQLYVYDEKEDTMNLLYVTDDVCETVVSVPDEEKRYFVEVTDEFSQFIHDESSVELAVAYAALHREEDEGILDGFQMWLESNYDDFETGE